MSLDHVDEISLEPRLLFTEPWDPIVVRRGDALGSGRIVGVLSQLCLLGPLRAAISAIAARMRPTTEDFEKASLRGCSAVRRR